MKKTMSDSMKLKEGIVVVFLANIINLVINLATNFLLPKYLSVDSYAFIKTYQLYSSYAGVLSLGFVDGMYLKYGGKEFIDINKGDLDKNISSFRIFQLIITFLLLPFVFILKDYTYAVFVFTILPVNMAGYFRSLYQSIGEFKKYSRLMNSVTILTFMINIVLLFVVKTDVYQIYLALYVILNIVIWLMLELYLRKSVNYSFSYFLFSLSEMVDNIKDGILLMLGNFSNTILTSMDRWFIKALMNTYAFAQYSFACSMENFVNFAVTPITITLYNYFCNHQEIQEVKKIRNLTMIFATCLISCAFPAKFILENFLTKYIESSSVMFILFAAQFFYVIIKSIYVNLYKAQNKQKVYFTKLILVIAFGFVFNIACYLMWHAKESFAIGTFLSAIVWLILSYLDFKWMKYSIKEITYIVIIPVSFIIVGYSFNSIIGFLLYFTISIVLTLLLMHDSVKTIKNFITEVSKRMLKSAKMCN